MLGQPAHADEPFPYFRVVPALSSEVCAGLEGLFDVQQGWQHRDEAFYRCYLRECTDEVDPELRRSLCDRMRQITGLPLTEHVVVTAQRMEPGQVIGTHSDRPLVGYEIARLVVQLNRDWDRSLGGVLQLFAEPEGPAVGELFPAYNEAFGFVLHPESHHGVTEAHRQRRTVVFNFWHEANTPALAEQVERLFADVHFSRLPASLAPIAAVVEATQPEEVSFRAGLAAWALLTWGADDAQITAGYALSAGLREDGDHDARLADYLARLHTDAFDLARWQRSGLSLASLATVGRRAID